MATLIRTGFHGLPARLALASIAFGFVCSAQDQPVRFVFYDPVTTPRARVWVPPQNWKSVTATVADRVFELQLTPESPLGAFDWSGWVDLSGLAFGRYELVITATGRDDHTYTAGRTITYDLPPDLDVKLPLLGSVATPLLPIETSCSRAEDCQIVVLVGETPVPRVARCLDLSAYDHSTVTLRIYAIDSLGVRSQEQVRTIHVESNPRLRRAAEAPGLIVDFDATRVLFERQGTAPALDQKELAIMTQVDGAISSVTTGKLLEDSKFLTPRGAVYAEWDAVLRIWDLHEFPDGSPNGSLGEMVPDSLKVRGNYLIWTANYKTYLRRISEGTTILIPDANQSADVSSNGGVSWTNGLYIFLNGKLFSGQSWNRNPLTDGSNAVWARELPAFPSGDHFIVFGDGSSETYLGKKRVTQPQPKIDYQIAGGWVAYRDVGGSGPMQIWLRSPAGTQVQLSDSRTDCSLESISEHGDVVYSSAGRMFVNQSDLGLMMGHPIWREGRCFSALGRELYQLDLGANPPLSIGVFGDQVVLSGSGQLQTSADMVHWSEVSPLDGTLHLDTPAGQVFYRLLR